MTSAPKLPFQPQGFLSVAKNIGIKDETLDFTVIHSTTRAVAVGMFTQSLFCGAPVIVGREHLAGEHAHTLVVNSKNANVATGQRGVDDARATCRWVAQELGIAPEDVIPSSTGVIGLHLPMDRFEEAIAGRLRGELCADNLDVAAEAIMTTDTRPKRIARQVDGAVVAGIAKGAGMIEPDMATMLAFVFTDAALSPAVLRPMLQQVGAQVVQHDQRGYRHQHQRHGDRHGERPRRVKWTGTPSRRLSMRCASTWPRRWRGTARALPS